MDQTAPLNGTTIKDQAWKEKKGFGPLIMVAVLLLGLAAFYAGQISGSSTVVVGGDDRGGLNGAILRGSNAQDVVEIVASASSSNVEADVNVRCRTSGPPTVFTKNMVVQPDVIYSGLDFSTKRYKRIYLYMALDKKNYPIVWSKCAEKCNDDPVCRTFSVHKGSGICYLHDTWLCPQKAKYETGNSDIFSGVCRPEGGWDMYGRCFSF